jgi:hypothetical protein
MLPDGLDQGHLGTFPTIADMTLFRKASVQMSEDTLAAASEPRYLFRYAKPFLRMISMHRSGSWCRRGIKKRGSLRRQRGRAVTPGRPFTRLETTHG